MVRILSSQLPSTDYRGIRDYSINLGSWNALSTSNWGFPESQGWGEEWVRDFHTLRSICFLNVHDHWTLTSDKASEANWNVKSLPLDNIYQLCVLTADHQILGISWDWQSDSVLWQKSVDHLLCGWHSDWLWASGREANGPCLGECTMQ